MFWFLTSSFPTQVSTARDWFASALTTLDMQLNSLAQGSRNTAYSTSYLNTFYFMLQSLLLTHTRELNIGPFYQDHSELKGKQESSLFCLDSLYLMNQWR